MFCAVSTVSTVQQKELTMLWYADFESITSVCEFRCECGVKPSDDKSITRWHEQFRQTGNVGRRHSTWHVSQHKCVRDGQPPRECWEHERNSTKKNAWCMPTYERVISQFFFDENIIISY